MRWPLSPPRAAALSCASRHCRRARPAIGGCSRWRGCMLRACVPSRSRARAATARRWPVSLPSRASGCSRSSGRPAPGPAAASRIWDRHRPGAAARAAAPAQPCPAAWPLRDARARQRERQSRHTARPAAARRRIQLLDREERALKREIAALVAELAPCLLDQPGVGPITAAQLLSSWSHRGRLRSEACFARLAGASPIPASSGRHIRHRLDRGGDRQLNRAPHTIIISRRKHHQPTTAYIERRLEDGKNTREAIRCLKHYLARSLFRLMEAMPEPA